MNETLRDFIHRWVNPATIRGLILIGAGLIMLAAPDLSNFVIRIVIGLGVIGIGLSDAWAALHMAENRLRRLLLAVVTIAAGALLFIYTSETLSFAIRVLGVLAAIRGGFISVAGFRSRKSEGSWLFDTVRGLFYIAIGVVLFVVPESLVASLLVFAAAGAVILGAIIVSYGLGHPDEDNLGVDELGGLIYRWFKGRDLGEDMRASVVDNLYFEAPEARQKKVGFWTLLVLSVVIATLGVLADSTAVVIGAMLVAPLMTPIMGVSAGIVNGWMRRVSVSFATVAGGVVVAVAVAWIVAVWTPQLVPIETNGQISSRIAPTMIDLMIAIAAGAAGAYATVDKRVSSSITGVAIAVALVPPLGVVGVMLQALEFSDALGAFLLFLTNLVSIILAGAVVFLITGFAPLVEIRANREKMRTVLVTVALGALIIIVPLAFTSEGILASATRQATTQEVTSEWIDEEPGLRLARVEITGSEVEAIVSGQGDLPSVTELQYMLEEALGIDVVVVVEHFPSTIESSPER